MADRTVLVNLKANAAQFKSEMASSAASMSKFDQAQAKSQANAEKWRVVGQASQVAGAAMAAGLLATTKAASDQEQAMGALDAVFKSNSAAMRENAAASSQIGLSQTEYANSAAKLGAQLTNLGMNQDDVAASTDDLINKAADMAAQVGGPTSQAVDAISAALRGERDPIEQYGVTLTDAGIKAEMAATGLDKMGATLSLIEKQMASSNMLGAWNRELGTTASQMAIARAEFVDASAALGTALLPAMTQAASAVSTLLGAFNNLPQPVQAATTYVVGFAAAALIAGPKIVSLASSVTNLAASLAAAGKMVGPITAVASGLTALGAGLAGLGFIKTIEGITNKVGELTGLPEVFRAIGSAIIGMVPGSGALMALAQQFDTIKGAAMGLLEPIGGLGGLLGQLTGDTDMAAAGLGAMGNAAAQSASGLSDGANAAERQSDAVKALIADIQTLVGLNMALSGSKDALIGQTKRLTDAVDANGRSIEGTTKGAVANREALRGEVTSIMAVAKATQDRVTAERGAQAGLAAGNRVMQNQMAGLRQSAILAGMNAKEFDKFARSLGLIPDGKKVKVTVDGADKAKKDLRDVGIGVKGIPGAKVIKTNAPNAPKTTKDLKDVGLGAKSIPGSTSTRTSAPNAPKTTRDLEGVDDAARKIPGSAKTNVSESGASATEQAMRDVQSAIGAIDRSINVHTTYTSSGKVGASAPVGPATGGFISGPGTSTSDSIPAMLSDGEYVIKASAVRRVGVANLDRLNGAATRHRLPGFAAGGSVMIGGQPYAKWAKKQLPGFLRNNPQWIEENLPRMSGNKVGTGAFFSTTKPDRRKNEKDDAYKQRVNAWKQERENVKKQFDQTVRSEKLADKWDKVHAREEAAAKTVEDLQNAKAAFWQKVTDSLRAASSFSAMFAKSFGSHDADVDRLTAAEEALAEARKAANTAAPGDRAAAAKALADALKEVAAAQAQVNASEPTPGNVVASFQAKAAAAEKYQQQVIALQAAGLSTAILEQVATMAPDDAQAMIDSLTGMTPAQIQELNAAQGRIDTAALSLGGTLAGGIYDPAIANARGNPNYTVAVEIAPQAISLTLDGQTIATAIANYNRRTGRAA